MTHRLRQQKPLRVLRGLFLASVLFAAGCAQVKIDNAPRAVQIAPAPYFDEKTGIYFPGALETLHREPVVDLEERAPGLGLAISYRNDHTKLDVFVYDLQASVIPTGIESDVVKQSFQDALLDLQRATDKRLYSNLHLKDQGSTEILGTPFLSASFSYGENNLKKDGVLLISGVNGQILKIRSAVTRPADQDVQRLFAYLGQSIQQSYRNGYGGLSLAAFQKIETEVSRIDTRDGIHETEAIAIAQIELVQARRHNRFDPASATLLPNPDGISTRIRFAPYPTQPATPNPDHLIVEVLPNGRTLVTVAHHP